MLRKELLRRRYGSDGEGCRGSVLVEQRKDHQPNGAGERPRSLDLRQVKQRKIQWHEASHRTLCDELPKVQFKLWLERHLLQLGSGHASFVAFFLPHLWW